MTKRKFIQDDDENAQDTDYRDYQFSDEDEDAQDPDYQDSQDPDLRDSQGADYRDYQFSDGDEDAQDPDNRGLQDPDYRDYQFSDDEYEPSLVDEDNEHLSIPSRRVTRSGSTLTASGSQDLGDEEAQGETSDSEGDASYEDNTSEIPRQKTADDPQVRVKTQLPSALFHPLILFNSTSLTLGTGAGW